ncbi:MAG: hypothetical protein DHS20C15_13500 [Planctomycetota bacterium]|nr:MAG: hypothetical protein DHS20C15_13500 [Planctomycetota bacterium]
MTTPVAGPRTTGGRVSDKVGVFVEPMLPIKPSFATLAVSSQFCAALDAATPASVVSASSAWKVRDLTAGSPDRVGTSSVGPDPGSSQGVREATAHFRPLPESGSYA